MFCPRERRHNRRRHRFRCHHLGSVLVLARLGEGCLLAGRMDEALHWAHETLALSNELKQRGTEACTLRLLGEIASRRDPPEVETAEQH